MFLPIILLAALQVEHKGHHQVPRSAEEYAKALENPKRDAWQKPAEVIRALALRPDEAVADLGAGSGYFTRRLAHHAAKVLAVDIDVKLLERAKTSSPSNVETVLALPDDPKLSQGSVDTIFICDVLHHIENRPAYYGKLKAALKPGGRIVIIDFHKRQLPVGPPPAMKLSAEDVERELAEAGFRVKKNHERLLEYQYFLEFVTR